MKNTTSNTINKASILAFALEHREFTSRQARKHFAGSNKHHVDNLLWYHAAKSPQPILRVVRTESKGSGQYNVYAPAISSLRNASTATKKAKRQTRKKIVQLTLWQRIKKFFA